MIKKVKKRDGTIQEYQVEKIKIAVLKALNEINEPAWKAQSFSIDDIIREVEYEIEDELRKIQPSTEVDTIGIEFIQDCVENVLMDFNLKKTAKAYIIYRHEHKRTRDLAQNKLDFVKNYMKSDNTANATIDDNSNVKGKNVGIMNAEIHKQENINTNRYMVMKKLNELYPDFDTKQYVKDLENGIIYKHDESSSNTGATMPYCCSISLYPFLNDGLKNIGGLSAAPKNLDSFCGMYCNLIFCIAGQFLGAVATSEFLTFFDYFSRKELGDNYYKESDSFYKIGYKLRCLLNKSHYWTNNVKELAEHDFGSDELNKLRDEIVSESERSLTKEELDEYITRIKEDPNFVLKLGDGTRTIRGQIHQYFQQVTYTINQSAANRGMQSAFTNFSYFDKDFFEGMFGTFYFPDGSRPIWESVQWLQEEYMHWFNQERLKTMLTFPVESTTLLYKDGKFTDERMLDFIAKEYAEGHSMFTYISSSVDSLSSCCRLKNKIQTKEFNFTNGNMGVETGSKSVISLNLNRIIQNWSKEYKESTEGIDYADLHTFYAPQSGFKEYLIDILERVYKYHTAYNELLWDMYNTNLLPVYSAGFLHLNKQYLTIGIIGLTAAAEYMGIEISDNPEYKKFVTTIFKTIKEQNLLHKTKKTNFNTECVPAESAGAKLYNKDKKDGYWIPSDINLYTSYMFKPYDSNTSVLTKFILHGKEYIGDYLDGGASNHVNLDSHLSKEQYKKLIKFAAENGCEYFGFNIPNAECDDCGFIAKQPFDTCPKCGSTDVSLWDRPIGYLSKVKNWSKARQIERETRVYTKEEDIKL